MLQACILILIIAQQCVFIRNRLNNTDYWNERGVKTLVPLNTNTPSKHIIKETVDKEMQFVRDLGAALRVDAKAEAVVNSTYKTIADINKANASYTKPKVMIVEFISSMISYDNTKLVGDMVSRIGGKVAETPPVIGFENVVKKTLMYCLLCAVMQITASVLPSLRKTLLCKICPASKINVPTVFLCALPTEQAAVRRMD